MTYKLTPAIKFQKELMQQAIDKLYLLEEVPNMIAQWDETRAGVIKDQLIEDYADIMAELRNNLNSIG
jgi:hypothetical protein